VRIAGYLERVVIRSDKVWCSWSKSQPDFKQSAWYWVRGGQVDL